MSRTILATNGISAAWCRWDMSPAEKFLQAYQLDNSKLAEEFKDIGWRGTAGRS